MFVVDWRNNCNVVYDLELVRVVEFPNLLIVLAEPLDEWISHDVESQLTLFHMVTPNAGG